jgi:hypothetical protein
MSFALFLFTIVTVYSLNLVMSTSDKALLAQMGDAAWLGGRYRGGDDPPHPLFAHLCWYILALSVFNLFSFWGLAKVYSEKKLSGKGLWM